MGTQGSLERIVEGLTPARLREIVRELSREGAAREAGVSLPAILDVLCAGIDLGSGAEAWSAQLALKRVIREVAAQIPGLLYIEGDA